MSKILFIDDDADLTHMLCRYLGQEGFEADAMHDSESATLAALTRRYDLVVMDVMMPRLTGVEALKRIRASSDVPVVMLSARSDNLDRIVGLDLGADDYVPKPCSPGELVARIRAILRRSQERPALGAGDGAKHIQVGALRLWPASRRASWQGQALALTGTEFLILEVLAQRAGQLVSKQDISMWTFGRPLARFDRRIDVHISAIRQKLGPREGGLSWIDSVRGRGYQLLEA